jgi:hypothetical protein
MDDSIGHEGAEPKWNVAFGDGLDDDTRSPDLDSDIGDEGHETHERDEGGQRP